MLKSALRLLASEDAIRTPSRVIALYFGAIPLITTFVPSPPTRVTDTPGSLPIDSAAFASASSCILAEETTFTIDLDDSC